MLLSVSPDPLVLISVIPNQGAVITNGQTLNVAPTQITLNFPVGESIDPTTLGAITITRGGDGVLGNGNDVTVTSAVVPNGTDSTGFRGLGTTANEVVIRFDENLPSDLYDIHIAGTGTTPLKDINGNVFNNSADQDIKFTLDLGAQVASVVPQPVSRNANGTLTQNLNEVDVYFTNNTLTTASAQNVTNYELINTKNTASNADDTFVNPMSAVYSASTNMVKLTFAAGQVSSAATYRLRVGNNDPLPLAPTSVNVASNPLTYPGDTLGTAFTLGSFGSGVATGTLQSVVATGAQITNVSATGLENPGNTQDPGHRDIPIAGENSVPAGPGGEAIPVITYGFPTIYGSDPISGSPLFNQITAQQEQDAEAIFALYSKYLGVQFELDPAGGAINVVTGDPRVLAPTLLPSAVGGIAGGGLAIINAFDDWSGAKSEYGGGWMTVAMHEIGHTLGYLHDDASPPLTIMNGGAEGPSGNGGITTVPGLPGAEPVFPGDIDIANGQFLIQPDANDINMYQFTLAQSGTVSLETIAERLSSASLLDTVLTVFDSNGNKIASNDNYYGSDSLVQLDLASGTYYVGVTSVGNTSYNPLVPGSGSGGTSQGAYDLRLDFQPDAVSGLVSASSSAFPNGVPFDGDADGQPGGTYNYWFQVQTAANTVYVDKANNGVVYTGTGALGSITNPYTNIATALAATTSGDVVRIIGNSKAQGNDAYAYNIGFNQLNQPLADGSTMSIPKGVTVVVDNGGAGSTAVFKLSKANISVGSISQGIDLSGGALQILGTPTQNVIFTSYNDQTVAPVTNPLVATPSLGDWGGIVFNGDADHETNGIFLDSVDHATIKYGGGQVVVNSTQQVFDPIHLIDSRPSIQFNTILDSADAAMSGDPNSFADTEFSASPDATVPTPGYTADYGRTGPAIHGNILQSNSINGMFVRIRTQAGQSLDQLTVPATFADTDITYVLTENLEIASPLVTTKVGGANVQIPGAARVVNGVGQVAGSLVIDPGVVVKLGGSRIETTAVSGSQLIAEGTAANPIIMTSLLDTSYGAGGTFATTNNAAQLPKAGDWAGLYFGPATSASLDFVILQYAGGQSTIEGGSTDSWNPIEVYQADVRIADSTLQNNAGGGGGDRNGRQASSPAVIYVIGAQPIIVNNIIQNNGGPAISINANALNNDVVPDTGRDTGLSNAYTQFFNNYGPLVRLNALGNNTINGMLVRGAALTTQSIWDDTDIVHVLEAPIEVGNQQTQSGLRLQSSSTQSLVVKLSGVNAGFTADGTPLDISDRIGGTVQIIGQPGHPVVLTALADDSVGAGFDPSGNPDNDTNNDGTSETQLPYPAATGPLNVTVDTTAQDLLNALLVRTLPTGVTVGSPTYTGGAVSSGTFTNGNSVPLGIYPKGALITTGNAKLPTSNTDPAFSTTMGSPPDPDLNQLLANTGSTGTTTEASVLTFTVNVAAGSGIHSAEVYFQFGSEEFPDFVGSEFNDVLGGFVNGGAATNFMHDSSGQLVSINSAFFTEDNTTDKYNVEYNGLTTGLLAKFPLQVGVNTVKIAIGDVGDTIYDSGVFLSDLHFSTQTVTGTGGVSAAPTAGAWQGVTLGEYSNDTNMLEVNEEELGFVSGKDTNNTPQTAQFLGALAPNQVSGNDTQRLGFEVNGTLSQPSDVDVYSFTGQAGTQAFMQIDRTSAQLNSIIELVDSNGAVIASETTDASGNPIVTGLAAQPINGNPLSQGQLGPAITDPYSVNNHDAAMRVVLPGAAGSTNTYYVRVRSDSSNLSNLTGGQSDGLYTLQIRLQQQVQFPGSVVQYANINYSTNGVQVLGQPNLSPLLGETESNTVNSSFATAQDLGNLLSSNQATVAVGGSLNSSSQVDWYKLTINYDLIQRISGASADKTWPTMFDMDYADGLTRADTTMGIYDANGNLILIGRDSSVADDQPTPNSGADTQNLAAGSQGSLDPFIGTQQMPVGPSRVYYIAVSSAAELPQQLDQTYNAAATNPLIRLEPIDSVNRVVEDHITADPIVATKSAPAPSGTAGAPNLIFGNTAASVDSHDVAYTLSNVVLYVVGPAPGNPNVDDLYTTNPSTGTTVTNQGALPTTVGDIAMRNDGELYTLSLGNTDTSSGNYTQISSGTAAALSSANDGIVTYQIDPNNPINTATGQPNLIPYNHGVQFTAFAYNQSGTTRTLYAIGQIPQTPVPADYGSGTTDFTTNLIYQLDPNTGLAVQSLVNPKAPALPTDAPTTGLLPGVNLLMPSATGLTAPPDVVDGETITIPGGPTTVTFEFDSGPSAQIDAAGGQDIRDGQKFTVDGKTYEFNEGKVFNVTGPGTSFNNHDTFTVTNAANVTDTFEFLTPGSFITNPGNIAVPYGPGSSATAMATAMVNAINGVIGFGVVASPAGGANPTRINLTGDNNIATGSAGVTVDGNFGVTAGNIQIQFNEAQTPAQIGATIQSVVSANDASVQAGFARDRVNFYGANSATTNLTLTPPAVPTGGPGMTDLGTATGVTPGNVAVPFLFSDTGSQLATKLAAAINGAAGSNPGFAATAVASGSDVQLFGSTGAITHTAPISVSGSGGAGGNITGIAFLNNVLYAVTDQGGLFIINNPGPGATLSFVSNITTSGGAAAHLSGLTAGPPDVNSAAYANDLFATDTSGTLYAFNTAGVAQKIFNNNTATSVSTGVVGATGLAFSTLDYNLWHVTTNQSGVAGHGINTAPDESRTKPVDGGTSLYFGLDAPVPAGSPGAINTFNQPDAANYATNSSLYNTYALPGGASGETISNSFSLAGYSPYDKPTLYFTYLLNTRDVNASMNMEDDFRVYVGVTSSTGATTWTEVATNNSTTGKPAELPAYLSSDGGGTSVYRPSDAANQNVQELFDNTATWRQARIDLGNFAGQSNLKLMFSFSTSGVSEQGGNNQPLVLPGDATGNLNNAGRGTAGLLKGAYVDDIMVGFAGRGEMVTGSTSDTAEFAVPVNPDPMAPKQSLVGAYQFEVRRGTVYGVNTSPIKPDIALVQSFDINDRLTQALTIVASGGSQIVNKSTFTISDGINSQTFEFLNAGQTVTAGFVKVTYSAGMSAAGVANAIVTAINGQTTANVQAANADPTNLTSNRVNLFNAQSVSGVGSAVSGNMSEDNDTTFDAVNTGLSSANPGVFTATGQIGDNPNLLPANEGFDVDLAQFQLNGGGSVSINLTASALGGANTLVQLFNGAGVVVASKSVSSDSNPLDRTINYTAPANGTGIYYIGISGSANSTYDIFGFDSGTDGGSIGTYTLTVQLGAAAAINELLFDNQGDTNTPRLQGYTLIADNTILNSSQNGILISSGARAANGDPVPGSPRVLPVLNSSLLVPGVAVVNNVVGNSGVVGINLVGDQTPGEPAAPSLFTRVVNNTVYGGSVATGIGISVSAGAAPTLMNNIIANTATAVSVDGVSSPKTVLEANLYQNNTSNGVGGGEQFAIQLQPSDPLFVNPTNNDFYLAENSKAIDSSLNSLQDRPTMVQVDAPLGIPAEPIIAPSYDELGQLRVDDPVVSSPPGLGQNVFIDRGALDRADFTDPTVALSSPTPNNSNTPNVATIIGQFPSQFSLQFQDGNGTGIDPATVSSTQFILTGPDPNNPSNTITLQPTLNYLYSYDATNHIVRFTAAQGVWTPGTYTITVNNNATTGVKDLAGNPLSPNNASGTAVFTITVSVTGTSPWQNPTNNLDVNNDGTISAIDALIDINALNSGKGGTLPLPATVPPYYDVNGDGVLSALDVLVIINYLNSHTTVTPGVASPAVVQSAVAAPIVSTPVVDSAPADVAVTVAPSSDTPVVSDIGFALAAVSPAVASPAVASAPATGSGSASPSTATGSAAGSAAATTSISADAQTAAHDWAFGSQSYDGEPELETALADMVSGPGQLPGNPWSDDLDYLI